MVHVVEDSSAEEEEVQAVGAAQAELAGGRQAHNEDGGGDKKRKLERAFMDRGVSRDVGLLTIDDHFSSAIVSDMCDVFYGWPDLFSRLLPCLPFTYNLSVPRFLRMQGLFVREPALRLL